MRLRLVWPRALRNCAPSAPMAGASARPLNFTVRSHFREIWRCEELGVPSLSTVTYELRLTG